MSTASTATPASSIGGRTRPLSRIRSRGSSSTWRRAATRSLSGGRIAGSPASHRIASDQLSISEQRTYDALQLNATATGAYALLVHDNIAGRDVLYAGRLAADTGASIDNQPSGAIAGVGVTDDAITWMVNGQQHAAMLP
jgi:hypothetical protein